MKIEAFKVEEWMNKYETGAKYNIAETCVDSVSTDELFEITKENKEQFIDEFTSKRLTYGYIEGKPEFKDGICNLYKTINPKNIVITHGAAGANHHVFYTLISPGDRVISIMPTYQQLYSIPKSYNADLQLLYLTKNNNYLPDLEELKNLVTPNTKMICINNPNNPTGALMSENLLMDIVEIAREVGAYILCDEVYRHLTQDDTWSVSIADLYEKGISVSSMSKVFSLAGLRLGWIATRDDEAIKAMLSHRDYTLVSCGMFDEALAAIALKHSDLILKRNREIVRRNLAVLDEWVKKEPHVSYVKPKAGTTALVYYNLPLKSIEFCDRMYYETGAFVTPGECFEEEYSIRIGYACDTNELIEGLKAVSEFIKKVSEENE